jgi:hypothetical protein
LFRVGPIEPRATKADLVRLFGEEQVVDAPVYVGEGESEPGLLVFGGDAERELRMLLDESGVVDCIYVIGTRWRTEEGIGIGTDLKTLEKLNGYPFWIFGFGWDYGGTVSGFGEQGRLGKYKTDNARLLLRTSPPEGSDRSALRQVEGDRTYSSGHPAMQSLNPRVYEMLVIFE